MPWQNFCPVNITKKKHLQKKLVLGENSRTCVENVRLDEEKKRSNGKKMNQKISIKLSRENLSIDEAKKFVSSPNCGAISIFIGTTRINENDSTT